MLRTEELWASCKTTSIGVFKVKNILLNLIFLSSSLQVVTAVSGSFFTQAQVKKQRRKKNKNQTNGF